MAFVLPRHRDPENDKVVSIAQMRIIYVALRGKPHEASDNLELFLNFRFCFATREKYRMCMRSLSGLKHKICTCITQGSS